MKPSEQINERLNALLANAVGADKVETIKQRADNGEEPFILCLNSLIIAALLEYLDAKEAEKQT